MSVEMFLIALQNVERFKAHMEKHKSIHFWCDACPSGPFSTSLSLKQHKQVIKVPNALQNHLILMIVL